MSSAAFPSPAKWLVGLSIPLIEKTVQPPNGLAFRVDVHDEPGGSRFIHSLSIDLIPTTNTGWSKSLPAIYTHREEPLSSQDMCQNVLSIAISESQFLRANSHSHPFRRKVK